MVAEVLSGPLRGPPRDIFTSARGVRSAGVEVGDARPYFTAAEATVYILHTSGSTGRPKGVTLSHRALCSHLLFYPRAVGLDRPWHRTLQTSAFTFDMSYSQIFGPFACGSMLGLARENLMLDPALFAAALHQLPASFAMAVPSVLAAFAEHHALPCCLASLGSGGEALPVPLVRRLLLCGRANLDCPGLSAGVPGVGALLHNRYGPTECAINAALFGPFGSKDLLVGWEEKGCPEDLLSLGTVPIGTPAAHRQLRLAAEEEGEEGAIPARSRQTCTERFLAPLPGMPGELLLGGPGLALGYSAGPAGVSTSSPSFSGSPFAAGRLYRTGDLVRWLPERKCREKECGGSHRRLHEGPQLLFLGRRDFQVKLHGQRVELGEVEAALRRLPEVSEAAVLPSTDGENVGVAVLVAFVAPPPTGRGHAAALLDALRLDLPAHMVPARIRGVETLPRSTAGKLDRRELGRQAACLVEPVGEELTDASRVAVVEKETESLGANLSGLR